MKSLPTGTTRQYTRRVQQEDLAHFEAGAVHDVYATFALARDAEWSGRLLVLELKEDDEEGIGTGLTITHLGPAFCHQELVFTSTLLIIDGNEVATTFETYADGRLIAKGTQTQKVLKREKIDHLFAKLRPARDATGSAQNT